MYDTIVTIESVQRKAREQYARGILLSECPMPFGTKAEKAWKEEWLRLDSEKHKKVANA